MRAIILAGLLLALPMVLGASVTSVIQGGVYVGDTTRGVSNVAVVLYCNHHGMTYRIGARSTCMDGTYKMVFQNVGDRLCYASDTVFAQVWYKGKWWTSGTVGFVNDGPTQYTEFIRSSVSG